LGKVAGHETIPDHAPDGSDRLGRCRRRGRGEPWTATAMVEGSSVGIPAFADKNGAMVEADGGVALSNVRIRNGKDKIVVWGEPRQITKRHRVWISDQGIG
jgi:hypothetical protein